MKKSLMKKKFWKMRSPDKSIQSILIITFLIILLLVACSGQENDSVSTKEDDTIYFIPPTLSEKASPIQLDTPTPPPPSPTPACDNDLKFISDVTVPDGAEVAPGAKIEKIWKVENAGSCNWEARYTIQFISGDVMGAQESQALFPARSGSEVEIQIVFIAPSASGRYNSFWQGFAPSGEPFGEAFYVDIIVNPDLLPTDTPIAEPEASPTP